MSEEPSGPLALLDRKTVAQIALGFVVAVVVLGLFAVGIGVGEIRAALAGAELEWLALGCLSTLLCLTAWGKSWQIVLRVAGVEESFRRLVVTYYAATFANYVTPLGQAGGEPFIAYVLSRDTDASYEGALASVVTADLLNMLPFVTFSGVGFAALIYQSSLPETLEPLAAGLMGLAVGVPVLAAVGWRYRFSLGRLVLRLAAPVARRTQRLSVEGLRERLRELNDAFQRIARDRRALVSALFFAYLGWLFFALPLYFAGLTIGRDLDLLLVLFIVPASTLAGLVPSPGGLGGVEAALLALLVGLLGVTTATGYAVALVYRLASYWFALGLGGVAALYVIARN
ncbi:lysylphosphatidylglycerol synthase transmembrane domain-containing protein [Halomicrobium salinisoli]|uniref:lysylphosphatidylglycerol synthase transmembrane domain-containing protein n=1 Tax=Halomicrobium salinisoli TaxID=2878391 RepID=UPI001CEFD6E8|nr:flippase-like domain-containing protein [Halomicrobium salinisoli]